VAQGPSTDAIAAAVNATIGEHCTSTLFPVMEAHAHGISKESLDEKLGRVARTTGRKIRALDSQLGVSESASVVASKTTEAAHQAWAGTTAAAAGAWRGRSALVPFPGCPFGTPLTPV